MATSSCTDPPTLAGPPPPTAPMPTGSRFKTTETPSSTDPQVPGGPPTPQAKPNPQIRRPVQLGLYSCIATLGPSLICRIEGVTRTYVYAPISLFIRGTGAVVAVWILGENLVI